MDRLLDLLRGGDMRSIGRVAQVIEQVGDDPALFDALFGAMFSDEPLVQMRAADALEKISRTHPHLLQPHKAALLAPLPPDLRQEVYWHIPLLLTQLALTDDEREVAWKQIIGILHKAGQSQIVVVNCLQGLSALVLPTAWRRAETVRMIRDAMETGGPAVRARGQKLLAALEDQ